MKIKSSIEVVAYKVGGGSKTKSTKETQKVSEEGKGDTNK